MPTPSEHKTVQARILAYAEVIGWTVVSREAAEQRRGCDPHPQETTRAKSLECLIPTGRRPIMLNSDATHSKTFSVPSFTN